MAAPSPKIRREVEASDLGAIIAQHGALYGYEHGLDSTFEAHVGASVVAAGKRGWPRPNEGAWIVELDGRHAGSLALTDEGGELAALRWFLLDRELRGHGIGRRLVAELLAEAADAGYERVGLETFGDLRSAARIYRSHGFELEWAQHGPRWGRSELTYQRYELNFHSRAQSSSAPSAGSSERPFSVSA